MRQREDLTPLAEQQKIVSEIEKLEDKIHGLRKLPEQAAVKKHCA
jgi:restriction endonuclease S subunit